MPMPCIAGHVGKQRSQISTLRRIQRAAFVQQRPAHALEPTVSFLFQAADFGNGIGRMSDDMESLLTTRNIVEVQ